MKKVMPNGKVYADCCACNGTGWRVVPWVHRMNDDCRCQECDGEGRIQIRYIGIAKGYILKGRYGFTEAKYAVEFLLDEKGMNGPPYSSSVRESLKPDVLTDVLSSGKEVIVYFSEQYGGSESKTVRQISENYIEDVEVSNGWS